MVPSKGALPLLETNSNETRLGKDMAVRELEWKLQRLILRCSSDREPYLRRTDMAFLHLEMLQRRASGEIKNGGVALDAHELQPREELGGEGPGLQHEEEPAGRDADREPELPDPVVQRVADPAVAEQLGGGLLRRPVEIQMEMEVEVARFYGRRAPARTRQQGVLT
jgi:hypothetical protein